MFIHRVVLASLVLSCGLFLVPRFIHHSSDIEVTRIMRQYQVNETIAQQREQIAQRVASWIDNSTDPCENFYQFACGGVLKNPPQYVPVLPDNMEEYKDIYPFSFLERTQDVAKQLSDFFNAPSSPAYDVRRCCQSVAQNGNIDDFYRAVLDLNAELIQNSTSESDSLDSSFWKMNFALNIGLVNRGMQMNRANGDVSLSFSGVLSVYRSQFSELLVMFKKYSSRIFSDEKISNASKLFDQISDIQCPISRSQVIMSVANLTSSFNDIPFEALLGPYYIPDVQVQLDTSILDCVSEVNQKVKNFDLEDISVLFSIITLRKYKNVNTTDARLCDYPLLTLFSQELQEYLFNEDVDIAARKMYHYIKSALLDSIEVSIWMDEPTRLAAKNKALRLAELVQIPDLSLPKFEMNQCSPYNFYFGSLKHIEAIQSFLSSYPLQRFNRIEWPAFMVQYTNGRGGGYSMINAFYLPDSNIFVLPYGILGSPFFETSRPTSMNFGSIGSISSHETSHGYDPQGRMYDEVGNMRNWWTNISSSNYMAKSQCFVDEYSKIPVNGTYFSGSSTLNENIADNAGLFLSWNAFKKYEAKYGKEESLLSDYSVDQLFFISFAQTWCVEHDLNLPVDPHSPPKARVLGTLRNSQAFADAFKCPAGSNMNPVSKCAIWESSHSRNQTTMISYYYGSSMETQKTFVQAIALILSVFILFLKF